MFSQKRMMSCRLRRSGVPVRCRLGIVGIALLHPALLYVRDLCCHC